MIRRTIAFAALLACAVAPAQHKPSPHPRAGSLPPGFVYLSAVAPSIVQDVRYAGYHNFVGRPIDGYDAAECVLTQAAAEALERVQHALEDAGLTLRVYDCYRPQRAVDEFVAWSNDPRDQTMKDEFYPGVDKSQLFKLGYLAAKSGHTRGSTVDLTIERIPPATGQSYVPGDPLRSCRAPWVQRFHDGSLDMGTGYDCMDPLSSEDAKVGNVARSHRKLLRGLMEQNGFKGIPQEWWHYTLAREPFPSTFFDFPIEPR